MASMPIPKDYVALLRVFAQHHVRYLIVGGYAVIHHTEPRYTKDFDVLVDRAPANAVRVYRALAAYGAPISSLTPSDFTKPYTVYQIGIPPVRIDVLMSIPGVTFPTAWANRVTTKISGVRTYFISRPDLIRAKRAAGRSQDLIDIDGLLGRS